MINNNYLLPSIKTISNSFEFKQKEKGSLFICITEPCESEEEALNFLTRIRKQYYDATHHCYSFKLQNGSFKYSDDGEPSGTAGIRIYNAQNYFEATNLISVVIRYYGGTKLGVGLLGKVYYNSTFQCLSSSVIEEKELYNKIEITYDFAFSKTVHHFVSKFKLLIFKNDFDTKAKLVCFIRPTFYKSFTNELLAAAQNKVQIQPLDEFMYLSSNFIKQG
ncbi:MAG: hypothetical protein FD143_703 [Ignavibacteria bacterium]|nr:MAG: hypothetical protein FD143_703 [Ignavibacteria bacterium]KAF0161316.1 MAG: hypothetical protein FD188_904 [Ignavibacteria bacterium]